MKSVKPSGERGPLEIGLGRRNQRILHIDRRTRASIEANVADAVSRRDRLLGRR